MRNDFAVFILTHGRADTMVTHGALRRCGYTGKIYLLVDDLDNQVDRYVERYGKESVVIFDKQKAVEATDACDSLRKHNSVVFARNANFEIAKQLGIKYFWQLDDDYSSFGWVTNNVGKYQTSDCTTKRLDEILEAYLKFFIESGAKSIGIAQGGDMIGGKDSTFVEHCQKGRFTRKCMNSFMLDTDNPVTFRGRVNDDVNLYVECGRRGDLFITIPRLRLWQPMTQQESGGCTDVYKDLGTYVKSFYSVLVAPSCVKLAMMGTRHMRIHHHVAWKNAAPKIVSEKHRKASRVR